MPDPFGLLKLLNTTQRWLAYRWVPKCPRCRRPLDERGICWFHSP